MRVNSNRSAAQTALPASRQNADTGTAQAAAPPRTGVNRNETRSRAAISSHLALVACRTGGFGPSIGFPLRLEIQHRVSMHCGILAHYSALSGKRYPILVSIALVNPAKIRIARIAALPIIAFNAPGRIRCGFDRAGIRPLVP